MATRKETLREPFGGIPNTGRAEDGRSALLHEGFDEFVLGRADQQVRGDAVGAGAVGRDRGDIDGVSCGSRKLNSRDKWIFRATAA